MSTHISAPGRLPVPPPRLAQEKTTIPALPTGTMVDGIDCGGMTDDPKKPGVPVYLQIQNRRALTPEQQAKIDAARSKAKAEAKAAKKNAGAHISISEADVKARAELKKAGADKVSVVKQVGAKLKSESAPKAKTKFKIKLGAKPTATKGVSDNGPRKGSKTALIAGLLKREKGCTTAQILEATGWPSVSVPASAKAAGLKLRKEKKPGEPTRYFGS